MVFGIRTVRPNLFKDDRIGLGVYYLVKFMLFIVRLDMGFEMVRLEVDPGAQVLLELGKTGDVGKTSVLTIKLTSVKVVLLVY
jgi:hypothetical protein